MHYSKLLLLLTLQVGSSPPGTHPSEPLLGFTAPSRKATIGAVAPGRIASLRAQPGQSVHKGDVIFELDTAAADARRESAQALADSDVEERIAAVKLEQAQAELARLEGLASNRMSAPKELVDARNLAATAALELDSARFRRSQARRDAKLQAALRAELVGLAPFDAVISEKLKEEGESVESRDGILSLVQLDPLEITADCPAEISVRVRPGDTLNVVNPLDPAAPRRATVTLVGPVIDAASQTTRLRMTVPNADRAWLAGLRVSISVPPEKKESL